MIPCAAPISTVSPACIPERISDVSDDLSLRPSCTGAFSTLPPLIRITNGAVPRTSTADVGTTRPVFVSLDIRPDANNPPTRVRPALGIDT